LPCQASRGRRPFHRTCDAKNRMTPSPSSRWHPLLGQSIAGNEYVHHPIGILQHEIRGIRLEGHKSPVTADRWAAPPAAAQSRQNCVRWIREKSPGQTARHKARDTNGRPLLCPSVGIGNPEPVVSSPFAQGPGMRGSFLGIEASTHHDGVPEGSTFNISR
jgi:hypothetical protein